MFCPFSMVRDRAAPRPGGGSLYFPVEVIPAQAGGENVSGWCAVRRAGTGQVLSFQPVGYRAVPNDEVFPALEDAMRESGFDPKEAQVTDTVVRDGARCYRTWRFKGIKAAVAVGDLVELVLRASNSFDGSLAFNVTPAAERLMCTNGMTIPVKHPPIRCRHTKGFRADVVGRRLEALLRLFDQGVQRWTSWTRTAVSDDQAEAIFVAMPGINGRLQQRLLGHYWPLETRSGGKILWSAYNALTAWASHEPMRASTGGREVETRLSRGDRVHRVMQSALIRDLEDKLLITTR